MTTVLRWQKQIKCWKKQFSYRRKTDRNHKETVLRWKKQKGNICQNSSSIEEADKKYMEKKLFSDGKYVKKQFSDGKKTDEMNEDIKAAHH